MGVNRGTAARVVLWRIAALLGFLAVAGGAFGAHALDARLEASALATFETGVRYAMYHALAMLAALGFGRGPAAEWAAGAFAAGVVLFSGSLVLLALTGLSILGAIAPLGGGLLLVGWAALGAAGIRSARGVRA